MSFARYLFNGSVANTGTEATNDTWKKSAEYDSGNLYQKSLSYGNMYWDAETTANLLKRDAFTWMCWIYVDPNESTEKGLLFGNNGFGSNDNHKYSIFQHPTQNDLYWSWMNDQGATTFSTGKLEGMLPSYEWTHVAFVFGDYTLKIYINGTLEYTQSGIASTSSSFAYKTEVIHAIKGRRLQDLRIYNEAVSEDTVKEAAYGLAQHYRCNTTKKTFFNGSYSFTVTSKDCYLCPGYYNNELIVGQKYAFVVECDSPNNVLNASHGNVDGNTTHRSWTAWLYMQPAAYTQSNYQLYTNGDPVNFNSSNYEHTQIGNTHYWLFTATYAHVSVRLNGYKDTENYDLNFPTIKVMKVDSINEAINLEPPSTTTNKLSSDTPRYDNSTVLASTSSYIKSSYSPNRTNDICISFWAKFTDLSKSFDFFKCGNANAYSVGKKITYVKENSQWNYSSEETVTVQSTDGVTYQNGEVTEVNSDSTVYTSTEYKGYAKTGMTFSIANKALTFKIDDLTLDVGTMDNSYWHNFVINSDGERNVKIYIDGVEKASGKTPSDSTIDRGSSSEEATFTGPIKVSDVRIYGKHLEEDDALGLYGLKPEDYKVTN